MSALVFREGSPAVIPASLATPPELAGGVQNIEALCTRIAGDYLRRRVNLPDDVFDDLHSYLMLVAWRETARYAPRDAGSSLVGYLSQTLAWRCVDWYRSRFGRKPNQRPELVSLDALEAAV